MNEVNKESIKAALTAVKFPGFSRDIVSFGLVRDIQLENGNVQVTVEVTTANEDVPKQIETEIRSTLDKLQGVEAVEVQMNVTQPQNQPTTGNTANNSSGGNTTLQQVRFAIAVASGKGGVGKSTVTVNLACALQKLLDESGKAGVGIMDCDIYGPSVPLMLGTAGRPEIRNDLIQPLENFGVRTMSMGFLVDEEIGRASCRER